LALTRALLSRTAPVSVVYGSTSGVYGDCAGDWVSETRALHATTPRAQRRVDAETRVRHFARLRAGVRAIVLRIPGIYAPDREGGTPRERLLRGSPVLEAQDDVFTNHIHADDLARACQLALWRGQSQRVYNVNDDSQLLMGDYFDMAADLYGLARPPRISRTQAQTELPAMQLSFMSESRRMVNARAKRELRLQLRYAQVQQGLR
jgi:nucleoside-diphosphate-sugar epimerase